MDLLHDNALATDFTFCAFAGMAYLVLSGDDMRLAAVFIAFWNIAPASASPTPSAEPTVN